MTEYLLRVTEARALTAAEVLSLLEVFRPAWQRRAACHGMTHLMFPEFERGHRSRYDDAFAVCELCEVAEDCRAYGQNERHGVWGGIPKERGSRPKQGRTTT